MDRVPLLLEGRPVGELLVEQEGLYAWFTARGRLPGPGLWCVWIVGEQAELRLGILEPRDGEGSIRRRFSGRMTAPLGRLLRGEVRPVQRGAHAWEAASEPGRLFQTAWLRRELKDVSGGMVQRNGTCVSLALPYCAERPFLLASLFCFAQIRDIGGETYAVFAFDEQEWPVLP